MRELTLTRIDQNEWRAIGLLSENDNDLCFTVERGWRNNERNVSCIPTGNYVIREHISPRFGKCIKVFEKDGRSEVSGRSQILFHVGNFVNYLQNGVIRNDTDGCILPVTNIANKTETGVFGATSKPRMEDLMKIVSSADVRLTVRNACDKEEPKEENIADSLFDILLKIQTKGNEFTCPHCQKSIMVVASVSKGVKE